MGASYDITHHKPRTQKGIGLEVLRSIYGSTVLNVCCYLQSAEDVSKMFDPVGPFFARPCPSRPRHGYIDSRVVKSEDEVLALLSETLKDDPKGEVMITPFINASHNAIWTPGALVIGKGHDGATAGKDTITIPLAGMVHSLLAGKLEEAGIGSQEWPFIEMVAGETGTILTQLRAGPKMEGVGGDYIPSPTVVQRVIEAKGDLQAWEKFVEEMEPGDVVWHPGGAMSDHYSIHAFTHHIPIIFGEKPEVGQELNPTHEVQTYNPQSMLEGIAVGEALPITGGGYTYNGVANYACTVMLIALHNATALTGENSKWIGMAAAIMMRLGGTALMGEARHFSNPKGLSRDAVYKRAFRLDLSRHRSKLTSLINVFRYGDFGGGGVGGRKWAQCGVATVGLFNSVRDLAKDPTPQTAANVVKALNVAVNQAHNGGWWLNKFCAESTFNEAQSGSLHCFRSSIRTFWSLGELHRKMLQSPKIEKAIDRYRSWPVTTLRPPRVSKAEITYQQGIQAIGLKIHSRLLKDKARIILAPVEKVVSTLDFLIGDCTYLTETENGLKVEIRHPTKGTVTMWEEKALQPQSGEMEED